MKKIFDYCCWVVIALGLLAEPVKAQGVVSYVLPSGTPQAVSAATPLPTTATFSPSGTQDVNIKQVGGNAVTTTVPVSGTFWQTTQPVSGTFFQAVQPVSQSGAWTATVTGNVASASADSGNPVKVGCIVNSALPTFTAGQRADCQMGTRGSIDTTLYGPGGSVGVSTSTPANNTTLANSLDTLSFGMVYNGTTTDLAQSIQGVIALATGTGAGVTAVEENGRQFLNITTAATTVVKGTVAILHTVTINTPIASATITIYNNNGASGTKVGTITLPSVITSFMPVTLIYDTLCSGGITVVTSGLTDITISFR